MMILDVGCGIGENLSLLKENGYKSVIGADISPDMVKISRSSGHETYLAGQVPKKDFDVLLFSHVIEHFGYPDIVDFLEEYFSMAKKKAKVIIITPTLYDAFFNDVDHIKPYYPDGLIMLFSENQISRQYSSAFSLTLMDIFYRRVPLIPYNIRIRHLERFTNRLAFRVIVYVMSILKWLSFGLVAKATGYAAIFELKNSQ